MAQHDYNIANQSGADFRADLNNALSAIATVNSGASEPLTTFAHQLWVDTSNNVLKIRNAANNDWITTGVSITASNTFTGNITGNADTATTLATARTINGTSFDGSANISFDTDSVSEGSSNLYFTNERVDDQVNTLLQAGTGIQLTYDDTSGTLTIANTNDADITGVVAGNGLTGGGTAGTVTLNVAVDDSSIEIDSDALQVKASGITNAMLAGSIANAKLSNSSVTINSNSLSLGGTLTLDTDDIGEGSTNVYYTDTRANSAIDARVTNTFINNLTGVVADTATALATARTISLSGDIAGSASFDGTSDITITSTIQPNSITLGTDTVGNYVQTITGTTNKITVSGSGSESADITLSLPDDVQIADSLTVAGNLTVNGTLTYLNTTNLDIADNLFQLNAGLTGSPVNDSGMLINRGNQDNGIFMWDESADKFTMGLTTADGTSTGNITLNSLGTLVVNVEGNVTGNVTGQVSDISNFTTANLTENTNLYFTDARARASISATGDISYNSTTGVISFTAGAGVTSVNTQTGTVVLDTDDISEGTANQYFTTARARTSISASGDIAYNSTTGVISFTAGSSPVTSVNTQTGAVVLDSDDIAEGSTNIYFTNARADARVNLQTGANLDLSSKSTSDLSEGTNLYYTDSRFDTRLGTKSTSDLSEGSNLYHTTERVQDVVAGQFVTNGSHTGISFVYDDAGDGAIDATVSLSSFSTSDLSEGTNLYYTDSRFDTRLGTKSTSNLSEGSNLYYTDARARASISEDSTQLSYNSTTGVLSYTQGNTDTVSEGSTNLYYTDARFDTRLGTKSTSDLSEGSNLYFTDARARAAISEDSTQLSYNSTTGVLSYTQGDTDTVSEGSTNLYYTDARANSAIDTRVTKTFVDALNVVAASATGNAGTATALQTARDFSISGDITASAISFNGTGNVALSASIDSNTVGITEINVTDGTNGQVLTTDGAGNLSFTTASGGTSTTINNNANNRIITGSDTADTLEAEANLTYDGTTLDVTGKVRASTGILFGTDTAASNTLHDYEEGTWTPSITFGQSSTGITHNVQNGKYVKIGSAVYVSCHCSLSSKGTAAGVADINGLPFTINQQAFGAFQPIGDREGLSTAGVPVNLYLAAGNAYARFYKNGFTGTGNSTVTNANFTNTTDIDVNFVYYTDS